MKTEEIIDRLRNPQKYRTQHPSAQTNRPEEGAPLAPKKTNPANLLTLFVVIGVLLLAGAILLITLHTKDRAENLDKSLDQTQVAGLSSQNTEFDPRQIVTYININELGEGGDRVPMVDELGATIPIISRYNYKTITADNYAVIGAAPWALSANIEPNLKDVELLRHLLNRPEVAKAFVARPDVAPLLADPQLLSALAQDKNAMQKFFTTPLVEQILAREELVSVFNKSRLVSTLLTSKAAKYYRDHPQEAAQIIRTSPVLGPLLQKPHIRKAVQENYYLKSITPQLLGSTGAKSKKTNAVVRSNKK